MKISCPSQQTGFYVPSLQLEVNKMKLNYYYYPLNKSQSGISQSKIQSSHQSKIEKVKFSTTNQRLRYFSKQKEDNSNLDYKNIHPKKTYLLHHLSLSGSSLINDLVPKADFLKPRINQTILMYCIIISLNTFVLKIQ